MVSRVPFKNPETARQLWHLIDARDAIVGRLANHVRRLLLGKHKPTFDPSVDCGDNVVVVNAELVDFTGGKWNQKVYRHHTQWPGGLKEKEATHMLYEHPDRILSNAVAGMLPKNRLRNERMKRLKIFAGPSHPFAGQITPTPEHLVYTQHVEPVPTPEELSKKAGFWLRFEKDEFHQDVVRTEMQLSEDGKKPPRGGKKLKHDRHPLKRRSFYEYKYWPDVFARIDSLSLTADERAEVFAKTGLDEKGQIKDPVVFAAKTAVYKELSLDPIVQYPEVIPPRKKKTEAEIAAAAAADAKQDDKKKAGEKDDKKKKK